jgi:hypothetical protein
MREQNAALQRCPFQHSRVEGSGKAHILGPYDSQIGQSAQHATQDIVIKVFVRQKTQRYTRP